MRITIVTALLLALAGCGNSWILPEAIVGVPLAEPGDFNRVRSLMREQAIAKSLTHSEETETRTLKSDSVFPMPGRGYRRIEYYSEPLHAAGVRFSLVQYSESCALVFIYDRSPKWTESALRAVDEVAAALSSLTNGRSVLLVKPVREYDGVTGANRNPDRPNSPDELCVRMELPDPRQTSRASA